MAIRKIARMGHPVLKQVCKAVDEPGSAAVRRVVEDLIDTCEDIGASGIAAPQIHEPVRVFVFRVGEASIPHAATMKPIPWMVCINPELEVLGEERRLFWERCLSVPGLYGQVPRPMDIRLRWYQPDGAHRSMRARGHVARLVQHEYDHLDGILYPMRMQDLGTLGFVSELARPVSPPLPRNTDDFVDPEIEPEREEDAIEG